ncbi:MAG: hypothetical protein EOS20_04955 [Mesorhizobium sp.]|uniref:hypothetical protein n=1 Tax=Mesorhizobium sp. TaxID=1871066 RepID=UPI000FE9BEAD|nr:hypothetical protein [Mesorhizobium sp.]RWQ32832.1 MAG: hypothetical protein EOS21_30770 [Mesorhizobium sp.]RWQ39492.1 MAG: hypothetical protein EOS20_04955 [Mesorhizobium sp.]
MPMNRLGLGLGLQRGGGASAPPVTAPANTVLPAISGTPTEGETLSCSTGTWTGTAPISYAYQWKADGTNIGGATANTFLLTDTQVGAAITCTVTAANVGGSTPATSDATAAITAAPFQAMALGAFINISGSARQSMLPGGFLNEG